ncbi:MAG: putative porin [Candidatus Omnitrophota bacterium]
MRKMILIALAGIGIALAGVRQPWAGEIDILVNKLVEKKILTPVEAQIILDETRQEVTSQVAKGQSYSLPKWVQSINLKGDLRLRYQYEKTDASNAYSRNRGRIRYRLGMEANPTEKFKVGAGLASGGADPRSTNLTWENSFETPEIRLDYAYAEYKPLKGLKIAGGRILNKDYLWRPTDLLWDSDINPNGGSLNYGYAFDSEWNGFVNMGNWIIDENGAVKSVDPFLTYGQAGIAYAGPKFDATLAGIYYNFSGVQGVDLDHEKNTNTQLGQAADAALKYDYDSLGASVEVGVKNLFGGLPFGADERIAVFGDFVQNVDKVDQRTGWAAGIKFGNAKVSEAKQWQMKWLFASLGKDAFPDVFPDSDRYGGGTDNKSHEVTFEYGLSKNVILGVDYYYSQRIKAAERLEHLLQADIVFKF